MRLWSIHPRLLDQKGLGATWAEGLQAQGFLVKLANGELKRGIGRGHHNHSQLERFLAWEHPLKAIGAWLTQVWIEADKRGYSYDNNKIIELDFKTESLISVTTEQLEYEFWFLMSKLKTRSPYRHSAYVFDHAYLGYTPHNPIFYPVDGPIEKWERVKNVQV